MPRKPLENQEDSFNIFSGAKSVASSLKVTPVKGELNNPKESDDMKSMEKLKEGGVASSRNNARSATKQEAIL